MYSCIIWDFPRSVDTLVLCRRGSLQRRRLRSLVPGFSNDEQVEVLVDDRAANYISLVVDGASVYATDCQSIDLAVCRSPGPGSTRQRRCEWARCRRGFHSLRLNDDHLFRFGKQMTNSECAQIH